MFKEDIVKTIQESIPPIPPIPEKPIILELTPDQKDKIIKRMENTSMSPPSLIELGKLCFNEDMDGRDRRAKLIKEFCSKLDFRPITATEIKCRAQLELTQEQKLFIENHASTTPVLQISRTLFNNNNLSGISKETRLVLEYIKTLNVAVLHNQENNDIPESEKYLPPTTRTQCIKKIEKYVHEKIDESKLSQYQNRNIECLISHLHVYRFLHQINNYDSKINRELFESTFIRYVWPKASDLVSEEVDQFIVLSIETVISASIQKRIEALQRLLDEAVDKEQNDENRRTISMSMVEAIGKLNDEYNQSVKRQDQLLSSLNGKRSERLKNRVAENHSLVSLVEYWRSYEGRQQLLTLAELHKKKLKDEVKRLKTLDDIKAEIFGIGENIVDA